MLLLQTVKAQPISGLDAIVEQEKDQFGGKMVVMVWKDTLLYQKATSEDLTVKMQTSVGCLSTFSFDIVINPFSGAQCTPADALLFLQMLLNKGTAGTKKVLSPESIAEIQKIQTGNAKIAFVPDHAQGYSYGLGDWVGTGENKGRFMVPSLSGGWAMIDTNKNLAVLILGKMKKEDKKEPYLRILEAAGM